MADLEKLRFPALETSTVSLKGADAVAQVSAAIGAASAAYVRLDRGGMTRFLFIHQGRTHGAGTLENGRVSASGCREFFSALAAVPAADVCVTDLPLFLCASVLFRKPPAAHIPASLLDGTSLLKSVRELGKDAVLVVRRGAAWSLAFCQAGEPVRLYAAPGETFPSAASVSDQIVEFVRSNSDSVVDLYDEIQLRASADAGQPLGTYGSSAVASTDPDAPTPFLVVRLGDRDVFHYPLDAARIRIGRGGDNEVSLDSPSVSRDHAVIVREGDHHVIQDVGSVNGLMVRGSRVSMIRLKPGGEVGIGVYTIGYSLYASETEVPGSSGAPTPTLASRGATIMLTGAETASIEHEGHRFDIRGPFFFIGSGADAHLKIDGDAVAPRHATIIREPSGGYRIMTRSDGWQELTVNGERVTDRFLRSGDEIAIGKHLLRFHSEPAPQSATRKL